MFSLREIVQAVQGKLVQGPDTGSVQSVSIDSRMVQKGQLFIAVKGEILWASCFLRSFVIAKSCGLSTPYVLPSMTVSTRAGNPVSRRHPTSFLQFASLAIISGVSSWAGVPS